MYERLHFKIGEYSKEDYRNLLERFSDLSDNSLKTVFVIYKQVREMLRGWMYDLEYKGYCVIWQRERRFGKVVVNRSFHLNLGEVWEERLLKLQEELYEMDIKEINYLIIQCSTIVSLVELLIKLRNRGWKVEHGLTNYFLEVYHREGGGQLIEEDERSWQPR